MNEQTPTEPLWPADFNLSPNHCRDVIDGEGCYNIPGLESPSVVLDIGANVGAFARWAAKRWPTATVHCYEPQPMNYALLKMTVKHFGLDRVWTHEKAVAEKSMQATLHENDLRMASAFISGLISVLIILSTCFRPSDISPALNPT